MKRLAIRRSSVIEPRGLAASVRPGPKPEPSARRTIDPKPIAKDMFDKIKKGAGLCKNMTSTPVGIVEGKISVSVPSVPQPIQLTPETNVGGQTLLCEPKPPQDVRADHSGDANLPKGTRYTDDKQQIKTVIWILRYISSCVRLVERTLKSIDNASRPPISGPPRKRSRYERRSQPEKPSPDEKSKREWENLARMVNRIESKVGLTCLGLPYALASLPSSKFHDVVEKNQTIRNQVADIVATDLYKERISMPDKVPDNIQLLLVPSLVYSIIREKHEKRVPYEDICKYLDLLHLVDMPVNQPLAEFKCIKEEINLPPDVNPGNRLLETLQSCDPIPHISPRRAINGYEVCTSSEMVQRSSWVAGLYQCRSSNFRFHGAVTDLWSYKWSCLHHAVLVAACTYLVSPAMRSNRSDTDGQEVSHGFIKPGSWSIARYRSINHQSGNRHVPVGILQIIIPTTLVECGVNIGILKQGKEYLGDDSFQMTQVPWNIDMMIIMEPGTCISPLYPIKYISILIPITSI
ncbi:hypothetical protein EDB81DRAFT_829712 [Dactylonectria macrodidyma]|uniref:Uncharacterized protein n=1 Tax=Dactylonectria macrodidyma TaxID=307937 RepID=A0A9P9I894_9HYPO|nr:hypothetical protein EDB81DRAFT_829712 [Dactylonectria macrodidyma]